MKKTIQGIAYDTETARLVCVFKNAERQSLNFWHAGLYATPRAGRYFLAGNGGLMTIFKNKSRIIPLSASDAKLWLEQFNRAH